MLSVCRLHVIGASGSGTTTLGRALATLWSVPHADADDYFWTPTFPPFVEKRREQERLDLMQALFLPRDAIAPGGSRADAHRAFLAWARGYDDADFDGRSRVAHEEWLSALVCPVLRLDAAEPVEELTAAVADWVGRVV